MTQLHLLQTLLLTTMGIPSFAIAQSADVSAFNGWWNGDHLTGNWGELRTRGESSGVTMFADFTADNLWNTTGGRETGHAYLQLLEFGVEFDLQSLTDWWRGGSAKASGIHVSATRGMTSLRVGDLNGASNIEAPEGARLYELWFAQTLLHDTITLQAGNLLADSYFAFNDGAEVLLNAGFGWSQFIAANTGTLVPAYPFAALGARIAWRPTDRVELQTAIFDGDALDNAEGDLADNPNGFQFKLHNHWFLVSEIDFRLNHEEGDTGLMGTYGVGGFYHSQDTDDLYTDVNGDPWIVSGLAPRRYDGIYGIYVTANQQVYQENHEQGLDIFARAAGLSDDRSLVSLVVDAGLAYTGFIPGRDFDVISAGFIYLGISENQTRTEETDSNVNGTPYDAFSDYEMVFEFTYLAWINNSWYVQPDLQYIVHPGGSAVLDNALVVGVRTGLSF